MSATTQKKSALQEALAQLTPSRSTKHHGRPEYILAGATWTNWLNSKELNVDKDAQDVTLKLKDSHEGNGIAWEWTKHLAKPGPTPYGVFLHVYGRAPSLEEAAAAVVAYQPELLVLEYLGQSITWYKTLGRRWTAVIGGEKAEVHDYGENDRQPPKRYHWTREDYGAKEALAFTGSALAKLEGYTPTLEEALRACVDAPSLFRRACAALVATLRPVMLLIVLLCALASACNSDAAPTADAAAPKCLVKNDAGAEVPRTCITTSCCELCGPGWTEGPDLQHTCVYVGVDGGIR
jgi:hypothetical protein